MTRPEPVRQLLDALPPARQIRARDGDLPAAVARIVHALDAAAGPGAAPKTLPVRDRFEPGVGGSPLAPPGRAPRHALGRAAAACAAVAAGGAAIRPDRARGSHE